MKNSPTLLAVLLCGSFACIAMDSPKMRVLKLQDEEIKVTEAMWSDLKQVTDRFLLAKAFSNVSKQAFDVICARINNIKNGKSGELRKIIGNDELLADVLKAGKSLNIKAFNGVELPGLIESVENGNLSMVSLILDTHKEDTSALSKLRVEQDKLLCSIKEVDRELSGLDEKFINLEFKVSMDAIGKKGMSKSDFYEKISDSDYEKLEGELSENEKNSLVSKLESLKENQRSQEESLKRKREELVELFNEVAPKKEKLLGEEAKAKALYLAVKKGSVEIVRTLLSSKAPVNFSFPALSCALCVEHTLLMFAVKRGNRDIVEELLNFGADVKAPKAKEYGDCSPLLIALREKHYDLVELLYPLDGKKEGLELLFQLNLDSRSRKLLLELGKGDVSASLWKKLFCSAVKCFHIDELHLLIDARAGIGMSLSQEDLQEELIKALKNLYPNPSEDMKIRQLAVIKFLMDHVEGNGKWDKALWIASQRGVKSVVEWLLLQGVSVNVQDEKGMTALMYASNEQCSEVVSFLLNHEAERDIVDNQGRTALMFAVLQQVNNASVIDLLLEGGADSTMVDNQDRTVLMMASEHNAQVIRLFLDLPAEDIVVGNDQPAQVLDPNNFVEKEEADILVEAIDGNEEELLVNSISRLPSILTLRNGVILGSLAFVGSLLYKKIMAASTPVGKPVENEKIAKEHEQGTVGNLSQSL